MQLLKVAASHFSCPDINGIDMEDSWGAQAQQAHWEARLVGSEFMGVSYSNNMQVSYLTLALFEDMGWYKVTAYLA